MKRMLSIILVLILLTSMIIPVSAMDTGKYTDIPDGWSKNALMAAISNGLLTGSDNRVYPDAALKRSEMAAIINRAFGAAQKADISKYSDVSTNKWYYGDMAKAVKMGSFLGDGRKLYPESNITRQEAFVVLSRVFKLSSDNFAVLDRYTDKVSISKWAKAGISALTAAGYIGGSNGKLSPQSSITRAEFAQVMYNIVKNYISSPGTYSSVEDGNVIINVPDVTLKGLTVKGDLIIADGVGTGNVTLDAVKIEGRTVVRGGGANSIHIINGSSITGSVVIDNINNEVRIVTDEGTTVEKIEADSKVILEGTFGEVKVFGTDNTQTGVLVGVEVKGTVQTLTVETKADVIISKESKIDTVTVTQTAAGSTLDVKGSAGELNVGAKSDVTVSGTITHVEIAQTGTNTTLITQEGAKVDNVVANAQTSISGAGTVNNVSANANDVVVDTAGTTVTAGVGTTGVKAGGNEVAGGSETTTQPETPVVIPPTGGGGGGGGSTPSITMGTIDTQLFPVDFEKAIAVNCSPSDATISAASSDEAVAAVSIRPNPNPGGPLYELVINAGTKPGTAQITYTASKPGYRSVTKSFSMNTTPGLPNKMRISSVSDGDMHVFISDFKDVHGNQIKWNYSDSDMLDTLNYYNINMDESKIYFRSEDGLSSVSATFRELAGNFELVNDYKNLDPRKYQQVSNGLSLQFTNEELASLFTGYDPAVHTKVSAEIKGAMYGDPVNSWNITASLAADVPGDPKIQFSTDENEIIGDFSYPAGKEKVFPIFCTPVDATITVTSSDEDIVAVYVGDNASNNIPIERCQMFLVIYAGSKLGEADITITASKEGYESASLTVKMTTIPGFPDEMKVSTVVDDGICIFVSDMKDKFGNRIRWDENSARMFVDVLNPDGIDLDASKVYLTDAAGQKSSVYATFAQLADFIRNGEGYAYPGVTNGFSMQFSPGDLASFADPNNNGIFIGFDPSVHKYVFVEMQGAMYGDPNNSWYVSASPVPETPGGAPMTLYQVPGQTFQVGSDKAMPIYVSEDDVTITVHSSDEDVAWAYVKPYKAGDSLPNPYGPTPDDFVNLYSDSLCKCILDIAAGTKIGTTTITITASKEGFASATTTLTMSTIPGKPDGSFSPTAEKSTDGALSLALSGFHDQYDNLISWNELSTYDVDLDNSKVYFSSGEAATLTQLQSYLGVDAGISNGAMTYRFSVADTAAIYAGTGLTDSGNNNFLNGYDPSQDTKVYFEIRDTSGTSWVITASIDMP